MKNKRKKLQTNNNIQRERQTKSKNKRITHAITSTNTEKCQYFKRGDHPQPHYYHHMGQGKKTTPTQIKLALRG